MPPPPEVLDSFGPALAGLNWRGVTGGFSGAAVWCGDRAGESIVALKAWPLQFQESRLSAIHGWMDRARDLPFVPEVLRSADCRTAVSDSIRFWDATTWMPGSPCPRPDAADVEAACRAVAKLHTTWRNEGVIAPIPGVMNRLRLIREWLTTPAHQGRFPHRSSVLRSLVGEATGSISKAAGPALRALEPWEHAPMQCQPCVRDLRGEHVLYTAGRVTGIVDYGAMAIDHPAVDLARLLGDFAEDRVELFAVGLRAYRDSGGEVGTSDEFLTQLAGTGALGSAINWLRRLENPSALPVESAVIEARLGRLLRRIEDFAPG